MKPVPKHQVEMKCSQLLEKAPLNWEITNNVTRQKISFIDSDAGTLTMETLYASFSEEPPMHYHPNQQEIFEVLEGELTIRYKEGLKLYEKGSVIDIEAGRAHAMWNSGFTPTKVSWKVSPVLDTEQLLRTTFELANQGKTDQNGKPSLIILLYLLMRYRKTFRLLRPNFILIGVISIFLIPIFYLKGFKTKY